MGGTSVADYFFVHQRRSVVVACEKLLQWQGRYVLCPPLCGDAHGVAVWANGEFRAGEFGVDVERTSLPSLLGANSSAAMVAYDVGVVVPVALDGLARISVRARPVRTSVLIPHEAKAASRGAAPWTVSRFVWPVPVSDSQCQARRIPRSIRGHESPDGPQRQPCAVGGLVQENDRYLDLAYPASVMDTRTVWHPGNLAVET